MIDTFGHFVVGGSLIVGLIVFAILLVIQFVVITNGAGRVAEVGARFTLDAMPGKQMAIDADLNSGLIDEDEARRRRAEVARRGRLLRRDGRCLEVRQGRRDRRHHHHAGQPDRRLRRRRRCRRACRFGDAMHTYSLLTIGDGLVSQIPALLLSVATGLIVTRATGDDDMGTDIVGQLTPAQACRCGSPASARSALCLIPGMPKIPFLLAGGAMLLLVLAHQSRAGHRPRGRRAAAAARCPRRTPPRRSSTEIQVDPLELELAADLIDLVDRAPAATCSTGSSRCAARSPSTSASWCPRCAPATTSTCRCTPTRSGSSASRSPAARRRPAPCWRSATSSTALPGRADPGAGLRAGGHVDPRRAAQPGRAARRHRRRPRPRCSPPTSPRWSAARRAAARPRGRQDAHRRRQAHPPVVVEELTPAQLSLGEIQRVLQSLLDESVSIRDLARIFEALSTRARVSKDLDGLVDAARETLGPAVVAPHLRDGTLHVLSFDPSLEQRLLEALRVTEGGGFLALDLELSQALMNDLTARNRQAEEQNISAVLVCAPQVRPAVRRLVATSLPRLPVLSYGELGGPIQIQSVGVVGGQAPALA